MKSYVNRIVIVFLFIFSSIVQALQVDTIYGSFDVREPVVIELIESRAFKRLQFIHQYGVDHYIHKTIVDYNRYNHSLGVFGLLRMFGAPLKEQIAGLLHDVSHTVFSHVGDHVASQMKGKIADQNDDAYQDDMHMWYLAQTDIAPILKKYGYSLEDINHKTGDFPMLERSLPDICADRLEYQLYGAYAEGWMTVDQVNQMLSSIHYGYDCWYFDDPAQARVFASNTIKLCDQVFGSVWNMGSYENTAKALLRAVDLGVITMQDIHFGTDDVMWQLLQEQDDPIIKLAIERTMCAKIVYEQASDGIGDLVCRAKFRGINPLVLTSDGLKRLTQLDESFAQLFSQASSDAQKVKYYRYKK